MFGFFSRKKPKGPLHARIDPAGIDITINPDQSILQAALEAGVPFPHSCRVGSCTHCKCRLVEGEVQQLTDTSYVLTGDELKAGYILACQTRLKSDIRIEITLDPEQGTTPARTVAATITGTRPLSHDILELTLRVNEPIPYRAGQYADLTAAAVEGERSYSFADAPGAGNANQVRFHVRRVPGGAFTGWLFDADRTGTPLTVSGPYGDFWLHEGDRTIVCVAGGSGLAPIKAMLEQAAAEGCKRDVVFLHGVRAQRDLYCGEEIARLGERWAGSFRFIPVLSDEAPDSGWSGARGFVSEQLRALSLDLAAVDAYLCGPPPMVDAATVTLKAAGLDREHIHADRFLDRSHLAGGKS